MSEMLQRPLPVMEVKPVNRERLTTVNDVDREREWLGLVPRAMGKCSLTRQQYAGRVGISEPLLSMQLSAVDNKHLSYRRMWRLGPEFWRELIVLLAEFHDIAIGATQQDAEDAAVGRLVREVVQRVRVR